MSSEPLEEELAVMSPGECHMARFFASLWLHDNHYDFDLVSAHPEIDNTLKTT